MFGAGYGNHPIYANGRRAFAEAALVHIHISVMGRPHGGATGTTNIVAECRIDEHPVIKDNMMTGQSTKNLLYFPALFLVHFYPFLAGGRRFFLKFIYAFYDSALFRIGVFAEVYDVSFAIPLEAHP